MKKKSFVNMVPDVIVIPIQKILARYSQNNLRTSYDHFLDKNAYSCERSGAVFTTIHFLHNSLRTRVSLKQGILKGEASLYH